MECLTKKVNGFQPFDMFDMMLNIPLDSLSCFAVVLRETRERWYMPNWLQYPLQIRIFPLFWSHTWKYNFQVKERLTKIEQKWPNIQFVILLFHFLHSNVPDSKCHKQKWRGLFLTRDKPVARVLTCACAIARIKWIRLIFKDVLNTRSPLGACLKDKLYTYSRYIRFIFNNYNSFVNSLLQLVRPYPVMMFTYVEIATLKLRKTRLPVVMQFLKS